MSLVSYPMAALLGLPAAVRDHSSPSARLAWLTLREADAPLSTTTLATETGTSADRIRRVLGTLQEVDLVEERDHPDDARRSLWTSSNPDRDHSGAKANTGRTQLGGI